MIKLEKF